LCSSFDSEGNFWAFLKYFLKYFSYQISHILNGVKSEVQNHDLFECVLINQTELSNALKTPPNSQQTSFSKFSGKPCCISICGDFATPFSRVSHFRAVGAITK